MTGSYDASASSYDTRSVVVVTVSFVVAETLQLAVQDGEVVCDDGVEQSQRVARPGPS
ncbi:hypothetical protein SVIOM342S_00414 [Streptomyces violaceorubidus]